MPGQHIHGTSHASSWHAQAEAQQLLDAETAKARDLEKTIAEAEVSCSHARQVQQAGDATLHRPISCKPMCNMVMVISGKEVDRICEEMLFVLVQAMLVDLESKAATSSQQLTALQAEVCAPGQQHRQAFDLRTAI